VAEAVRGSIAAPIRTEQVAHLLPATAPRPERARRIPFWKGLLCYWLMPGRLGPHLAVGTWKSALAAHTVSVLFSAGIVGYILLTNYANAMQSSGLHGIRVALARTVIELAVGTTSTSWNWVPPLLTVLLVPMAELALVAVAILAMPWCAGGDSALSAFRRSLKNVYWTTTALLPGSVGCLAVHLLQPTGLEPGLLDGAEILCLAAVSAMILVFSFLVLRMLIAGAKRYVGDPTGPAFAPREPLCDQCGYRITGLPSAGRCPECGLLLQDSLPGGRRQPTAWERHEFSPRGFLELVRLQGHILRTPAFFERLPVHAGHATARHFWWGTFLLIVLGSLVVTNLMQWVNWYAISARTFFGYERGEGVTSLVIAFAVPFGAQAMMLFAACLWAQFRLGITDYRVSATVCYYASPFIWPLTLIILVTTFVFISNVGDVLDQLFRVTLLGVDLTAAELFALVMILLAAGSWLYWWLRLCRALRAARYANV